MKKLRVAFIGTGGRSVCYARAYGAHQDINVVALADPRPENRKTMADRSGLANGFTEFDDWRDMLDAHNDLDGVVICTPNYLHAGQAVACLERGLPVALEKSLATTQEDCERIVAAEQANGGRVLLGFVLRTTPFYSKIYEWISGGAIGQIVSIQADELPGLGVTSIMNRSQWRRHSAQSGGSMLEKCCHDMDILNWMMACRPVSLTSYGSTAIFVPDESLPERCDDCNVAARCLYYKKPLFSAHEDKAEELLHEFVHEDNRCIYNIDKDITDVQSICLEYENGALANFMLNQNCMGPRTSRNFHAVGKKGRIWGNLSEKEVFWHDNLSGNTTSFDARGDGSGHGGGDLRHALLLHRMMSDPGYTPDQSAYAGYLSAVMCFASDRSRTCGQRINFRYRSDGFITLD